MESVKEKEDKIFDISKDKFGYTNKMAAPKLVKIVINAGTGSGIKRDSKRNELVEDRLSRITGQKPSIRQAKKSIASFKLREGNPVGLSVTLRGKRMYAFSDKLINIAFPRMKDFRGFDRKSVDEMGNLTLGLKDNTIFPESSDEEMKDIFGFSITFVTTAKSREEAIAFFESIGMPFKKEKTN